jgi:hypothetical protein
MKPLTVVGQVAQKNDYQWTVFCPLDDAVNAHTRMVTSDREGISFMSLERQARQLVEEVESESLLRALFESVIPCLPLMEEALGRNADLEICDVLNAGVGKGTPRTIQIEMCVRALIAFTAANFIHLGYALVEGGNFERVSSR